MSYEFLIHCTLLSFAIFNTTSWTNYSIGQTPTVGVPGAPGAPGGARATICREEWNCSEWSECVDGQQTRTCVDLNQCGTVENKPEEVQECSNVRVIFRTNVEDGDYRHASGSWIAADCNQDGNLEGYGMLGVTGGSFYDPLGVTPEGFPYQCINNNNDIKVKTQSRLVLYRASVEPDSEPVLNSEPTEPYASNGQEVYE